MLFRWEGVYVSRVLAFGSEIPVFEVWRLSQVKSEEWKHSVSQDKIIALQGIKMWTNKKTKAWYYCHTA